MADSSRRWLFLRFDRTVPKERIIPDLENHLPLSAEGEEILNWACAASVVSWSSAAIPCRCRIRSWKDSWKARPTAPVSS